MSASSLGAQNAVFATMAHTLDWIDYSKVQLPKAVSHLRQGLRGVDHLFGLYGLPSQVCDLGRSMEGLKRSLSGRVSPIKVADKVTDVFIDGAFSVDLVSDSTEILSDTRVVTLTPVQERVLNTIGIVGSAALLLYTMKGMVRDIQILRDEILFSGQFNLTLVKTIAKVFLCVACVFEIAFRVCHIEFSTALKLTVTSLYLTLIIGAHLSEKYFIKFAIS